MKIYKKFAQFFIAATTLVVLFGVATLAHASLVPSLSLSPVTGTSQVQLTVYGADPNVSVLLYYPSTSAISSTNIGSTNSSGYLTTTLDSNTYGIASNASVYVMVDGQASLASTWPNYSSNTASSLSLSQNAVTLSLGQSTTISAGVSGALSVSGNTNPSIANVSISGTQITVNSFNIGTTNITICSGGIGCSNLQVTVQSTASAVTPSVSLSQSNVTVTAGQSQTVTISGSGNYYVTGNSNSAVASASINGASLVINGISSGSDNLSVCASVGTSGTSCVGLYIYVTPSSTTNNTTTTSVLSFSQNNINLNVGQTQSIAIYGDSIPYYISTNSAPASVGANVAGTNVNITGLAFGGSNITVCAVDNQCGTFYVYVSSTGIAAPATTGTTVSSVPVLSSLTMASNDANSSFAGSGNVLTFSFSANQTINIPKVLVGGSSITVNGSGSGPYSASYTMTGREALPLPVVIHIANPNGNAKEAFLWISDSGTSMPSSSSAASSASIGVSSSGTTFTEYLYVGSTGSQVTALQHRLTIDGLYSGPITGTYGGLTQAAVKAYQAKHKLDQLGVVGPATRALLNQGI